MNRNLVAVVLVLLLCLVAFGFYRGWFALSRSSPDSGGSKIDVNLRVDEDKVKADAVTVKEKTTELVDEAKKEARELGH